MRRILVRSVGLLLLAAGALVVAPAAIGDPPAPATASDTPPPDVQATMDELKRGEQPTDDEMQALRAWELRHTRPSGETPGSTGIPADIQQILNDEKRGILPTPAQQARLVQWGQQMQQNQGQLQQDATQIPAQLQALIPASGNASGHAPAPAPLIHLIANIQQTETSACPTSHSQATAGFTADFGLRATITDATADTPESVDFSTPIPPAQMTLHGRASLHTVLVEPNRTQEMTATGALGAGALPPQAMLGTPSSFFIVRNGRDQLNWMPQITADGTATVVVTTPDGTTTHTSATNITPIGAISLDAMRPDAIGGPARAGMGAPPLPADFAAAVQGATFDFEVAKLAKELQQGVPVDVDGSYRYHLVTHDDGCTTTLDSTTKLHVGKPPTHPKLVLRPVDEAAWRKWIPRPYLDSPTDASIMGVQPDDESLALKLRVDLVNESGGEPPKCKVQVDLTHTSQNPGLAINYPVKAQSRPYGMKILPDDAWDVTSDGQRATSKQQTSGIELEVVAVEPGAWTHVEAKCADDPEMDVHVAPYDDAFLPVPLDRDGNDIADAWDDAHDRPDRAKTADDEPMNGQYDAGDGLTRYEEYRGAVTVQLDGTLRWHRLDPAAKDFFIHDKNGLVKRYAFGQLQKSFGATPHLVDARTMDETDEPGDPLYRAIDTNSLPDQRFAPKVFQHGVIVVAKDLSVESGWPTGNTATSPLPPCQVAWYKWIGPKCADEVQIDTVRMEGTVKRALALTHASPAQVAQNQEDNNEATIIHELGHAYGVRHHAPGWTWTRQADGSYAQPPTGKGAPPYDAYGVYDCVMRDANPVNPKDHDSVFKRQIYPFSFRFCRAGDPAVGVDGKPTQSDNCWGQLTFKTRP